MHVERALVLWNFVLYFLMCRTCCGIVEFYVRFFCVPVEQALALWNFVLYFSACQWNTLWYYFFCSIFFCVWNSLWFCLISCYTFLFVKQVLVLWSSVLYFSVCQWNDFLYCGILLYIFLCMESVLVVWNCFPRRMCLNNQHFPQITPPMNKKSQYNQSLTLWNLE